MSRGTRVAQTGDEGEKQSNLGVTGGEVLEDGSQLELVRDPSRPEQPRLLHWDGNRATIASKIVVNGRCYVPPEIDPGVWGRLRLPSNVEPYASTKELFHEIYSRFTKYSGLPPDHAFLLTCFVFSTFFVDCVQAAACVLLPGCASAEAIGLLQLLGWFCRHPVLLADAGLGIPDFLRPTRLICQPHPGVQKLIPVLQLSGFGSSRSASLREFSSATAIYVGDEELKTPFTDSCLWIPVAPARQLVSHNDEQRESPPIVRLQNQLLTYRLQNREKVKTSDFDVPEFGGSIRRLARILGACIVDAPDLRARLVQLLQDMDAAVRVDQVGEILSIAVEALLVCCHERRSAVHVGEIAKLANDIFSRQSESLRMTPREVGAKLKVLGFRTTKLDSGGRGLYLLGENCKRIHELARSYRVPLLQAGLPGCPYCGDQTTVLQ